MTPVSKEKFTVETTFKLAAFMATLIAAFALFGKILCATKSGEALVFRKGSMEIFLQTHEGAFAT